MRRSLEWLRGESQGNRRYAAVLILREMAENAPAVFNVHVKGFIDIVWAGLRDAKVIVREASVAALRVSGSNLASCFLLLIVCYHIWYIRVSIVLPAASQVLVCYWLCFRNVQIQGHKGICSCSRSQWLAFRCLFGCNFSCAAVHQCEAL